MKYERLTNRNEEPFYAFDACKECEHKDECDKWCAYTVGAYTRLHELEDKIERGELISTVQDERSEQEIAFFVKHNAEVRKQAVKEFAERVKMAFYYEFDELIPSIMADKIDELAKEVCGE